MTIDNREIAAIFYTLGDLLDVAGENTFRIRAYRTAAANIENTGQSMAELIRSGGDPSTLPGIGKDLSAKIREIVETGSLKQLRDLEKRIPHQVLDLLSLPGLGPKRVRALRQHLGIDSLKKLQLAARQGKIHALDGFGKKMEAQLLAAAEKKSSLPRRFLLPEAHSIADRIIGDLKPIPGVQHVVAAGSFRRQKETIGDLDLLVTAVLPAKVMERFIHTPGVVRVLAKGDTRSTILLRNGLQVDLRVVPEESYGAALLYFTGSQAHNIAVRALGQKKSLKINEYGAFRNQRRLAGATEEELYALLGLSFIEPELRENTGEIEAARQGRLPRLLTLQDMQGDLHAHTTETDGSGTLESMARAAQALGYTYLGITDHSQRLTVAHGMDAKRLARQYESIDRLNSRLSGFTVLKGVEVDILENGKLDLGDDILAQTDYTIASIHYKFNLPKDKQTERILRAMDHPRFTILGHPTGRIIGEREPYPLDWERLLAGARERRCALELSADPLRLDITEVIARQAKEQGVRIAISTDAHHPAHLENMRYGIGQARRGWLEPGDVLNTRDLPALRAAWKR